VAIWETGEWPEEWTFSTFIPLRKKGDLKQCANYRTIALVSRASKILLRIILDRIRVKTETEIADEQAGFRQGRGKRSNHESQNTDAQGTRVGRVDSLSTLGSPMGATAGKEADFGTSTNAWAVALDESTHASHPPCIHSWSYSI